MGRKIKMILRPLTNSEKKFFTLELIKFFSVINANDNRKFLDLPVEGNTIRPLSFGDFLKYLEKKHNIENNCDYINVLTQLIKKLENENLLINVGIKQDASPMFGISYYSIPQLTSIQKKNTDFFLGKILGNGYLRELYKPYIARIEGCYKEKDKSATGSGVLINKNIILTCAHNINDLKCHRIFIDENEVQIEEMKTHDKHDIGIIKIKDNQNINVFPYFGKPKELDKTLTLGYPPLSCMIDAALVAQSGEINAIANDWNKAENIIISSITRPGNSGGPVVSEDGFIVGIVVKAGYSVEQIDCNKEVSNDNDDNKSEKKDENKKEKQIDIQNIMPFYNAISSNEIVKILKELDDKIEIIFEDYNV